MLGIMGGYVQVRLITREYHHYMRIYCPYLFLNSLLEKYQKIKIDLCIIMFSGRSENNTHSSAMDQTNKTYTSHFYYFYLLLESILW